MLIGPKTVMEWFKNHVFIGSWLSLAMGIFASATKLMRDRKQAKLHSTSLDQILTSIDAEISRLQQVRALLTSAAIPAPPTMKRTLSAAARKRIGDAQRKRWDTVRKAA
jgi:hypothetical protein